MRPDVNMVMEPCGPIMHGRTPRDIHAEWEESDKTTLDALRIVECVVHPERFPMPTHNVFYPGRFNYY